MAAKLATFLKTHHHIAVLTGAGISHASGIPYYRGEEGIYTKNKNYKPIQYQEFMGYHNFRQRYWARSFMGYPRISNAQPNTTHKILTQLQRMVNLSIMTQNVDGLHQKSGSKDVIELHGGLARVKCTNCGHIEDRLDFQHQLMEMNPETAQLMLETPDNAPDVSSSNPDGDVDIKWDYDQFQYPSCVKCDGILKPDVVFFGENLEPAVRDATFRRVDTCDGLLVFGSSLTVYSAFRLLKRAEASGRPIAIVNVGPTRGDPLATLKIDQKSEIILSEVIKNW
ncbi:DHS-like NAD/FAD-binding domain-containing protein [Gorgonomyces haynaldii]|nr:DHS-like NAD/FAD-binding domain-containing protein [Gorgonomyces haynaldii]